jgi:hypothetical protein
MVLWGKEQQDGNKDNKDNKDNQGIVNRYHWMEIKGSRYKKDLKDLIKR